MCTLHSTVKRKRRTRARKRIPVRQLGFACNRVQCAISLLQSRTGEWVGWLFRVCWAFPPTCHSLVRTCAYGTVSAVHNERGVPIQGIARRPTSFFLANKPELGSDSPCVRYTLMPPTNIFVLASFIHQTRVSNYIRIWDYDTRLIAPYLERFDLISKSFDVFSETRPCT